MAKAASPEFELKPEGSAVDSGRVRIEKSCKPPEPLMQTHPAPRPPMGMATWVALSPLKVRCGPGWSRSAAEKGSDSRSGPEGAGVAFAGEAASDVSAGTAAARAAVEPATINSRRVGFFKDIKLCR